MGLRLLPDRGMELVVCAVAVVAAAAASLGGGGERVERETRDGSCKVDNGKCGNGSGFDGSSGRRGVGDASDGGGANVGGCGSFEFAVSG